MIGSSENRISYNGNGIATEFDYTFKILEKSDMKVLHVAADGTETLLVSDYYVDMEKSVVLYPGYAPGAEIPEQNRPPILPVGERLVLYREVPITQESALDKHWPFNVVENGLDKLTIICQQIWDRLQRSFYVSESTSSNFDPKVPIEAGKTFRVKDDGTGFEVTEDPGKVIDGATALLKQTTEQAESANEAATNAQNAAKEVKEIYGDGNFTPLSDLLGGLGTKLKRWGAIFANKVFASNLPIVYNNVAAMKADTMLWEGMNTKTLGYYTPNDCGGASYLIRAKADGDLDDGGNLHELANGLVAELLIENGTVCPEQFGAVGDGVTDDSSALQAVFDSGHKCVLLAKTYYIANKLVISKPSTIIEGVRMTNNQFIYNSPIIKTDLALDAIIELKNDPKSTKIENVLLVGNNDNIRPACGVKCADKTSALNFKDVVVYYCTTGFDMRTYLSVFEQCKAYYCTNFGLKFNPASETTQNTSLVILNCFADNCDIGYYLDNIIYSSIISCAADYCRISYNINDCQAINISGCGTEWCGEVALDFYGSNRGITVNSFMLVSQKETFLYLMRSHLLYNSSVMNVWCHSWSGIMYRSLSSTSNVLLGKEFEGKISGEKGNIRYANDILKVASDIETPSTSLINREGQIYINRKNIYMSIINQNSSYEWVVIGTSAVE